MAYLGTPGTEIATPASPQSLLESLAGPRGPRAGRAVPVLWSRRARAVVEAAAGEADEAEGDPREGREESAPREAGRVFDWTLT